MGGECLPVQCDVGNEAQVVSGVQKVLDSFGKIDILVNNAGMMAYCPTIELSLEQWQKVVDVSLTGYFLMASTLFNCFFFILFPPD
ncbi:MAG: SDR family NAD(P)-dependent oxidoreductase [Ruminococcus sp.]|jgi:NAD(P)-dependent dehydrogenase (short-subunit alcohol dehydrogenase family)|nr:SDR family NAD(P)-dependent oxidoreductase [Ruminococcus sp.]